MKLKDIKIKFGKDWKKWKKEKNDKDKYYDYIIHCGAIHIEGESIAIQLYNITQGENNMIGIDWLTKPCQKQILEYLQELIAEKLYEINK